jgi:aminoglycoside phosphotransferase (APT) family kinase protein
MTPEDELATAIAATLAEAGEPVDRPPSLTRIPGGASRETWLIDAGERRYVLRRDPPGAGSLISQADEARLIGLARGAGAPAPEVLASEPEGGRFETAGMLMRHVPGESVGPRVLRRDEYAEARSRLPGQLGEALARIHSVDLAAAGLEAPAADPALEQIEHWEAALDEIGEPLPAAELGLRWLRANAPEPVPPALVHGDFRLGNFIVDADGLAAVIDWELAHVGDPAEDAAWLCIRSWRFGNDDKPVAGVGETKEFLAAYRNAGGRILEPERLRYWEVFGNLKWAVICARQAHDHLTGLRRSHELASLGRRVCEPEWDMLELIRR